MITSDLYTTSDVKKVRELLLIEQDGKDKVTGIPIPIKSQVLDHVHDEQQLVRGVLHRQVNAYIGKLENNFVRMMGWWYPGSISQLLRQAADYLELEADTRYRHPNWQKKLKVEFNKLTASQQNEVLELLGSIKGTNPKTRKDLFSKLVMKRSLGYHSILSAIKDSKNE